LDVLLVRAERSQKSRYSALLELTGYWRYRKVFLGNDDPVIAANQDAGIARSVA
jgi:hypothetical protein